MPPKASKETKKKGNPVTKVYAPVGKIIVLNAILIAAISAYTYYRFMLPANMPEINIDAWWAPYPINPDQDVSIRPYKIEFSDVMTNDLKQRLLHRHPFAPPLENAGFSYGFNTKFLEQVLDYWQNRYNFKDREAYFNKYPHFVTNIQGLDIHYVHVKPKVESGVTVIPLLMLHDWPSSIREFYEIIPKLTTPMEGHNFVFEVIVPSLPGFGFSQAPSRPGFGPVEAATVLNQLMKRIGFPQYYLQGGDTMGIASTVATLFQQQVLGFHNNMPVVLNHPMAMFYMAVGSIWPGIVDDSKALQLFQPSSSLSWLVEETGYLHLQATKPDTLGAALTDSPAGLAAYILEKYSSWTNPSGKRAGDGNLLDEFALTHLLDNLMIYWATNSITTSMRMHAETFNKRTYDMALDKIPTNVPTCGLKFKHDLIYQPDSILKLKYSNYLRSILVTRGGHFAAFHHPDIMADDIYKAVQLFRNFYGTEKEAPPKIKTIYDFTVKDIHGKEVKLEKYKGHVVLIVNVASQCGLTDVNYKQLNELYEKYAETKGLRILAFPCNQFSGQEPGGPLEIFRFTKNRGVKFDVFEKVEVNGDNAHPLWNFLKQAQGGTLGDFIKWNFSKFIIDKNGIPVERLGPNVNPLDLVSYLEKYW